MSKYSTTAGYVTRDEAYLKFMHHLSEAADQAAVLSHLHNTEASEMDLLMSKGWMGIHELVMRMVTTIRTMVARKFQ